MVPLKQFVELMGGELISWDGSSKSATIQIDGNYLVYTTGERIVDGSNLPMKNPAKIIDNMMYVELTSLINSSNYKVSFYNNYCVINEIEFSKEMVQDYATVYYGADFSYTKPAVSKVDKERAENRIEELEEIIDGAKNAYDAGTITKKRRDEIINVAKNSISEYQEVIAGELEIDDVSERNVSYKAITGSSSSVVEDIQLKLIQLSYTSQTMTGRYDYMTFNNVAYFQIINELEVTGWLDVETVQAINRQSNTAEEITENSAIENYSITLDEKSKNVTISVKANTSTKKITVILSGLSGYAYAMMRDAYGNSTETTFDIPYSSDYVAYPVKIYAYNENGDVIGSVKTSFTACRNKTAWDTITETATNTVSMTAGVVSGIVNGAVVQPVMAASNAIDYLINIKNPEQYENNKEWRDSLTKEVENFMLSTLESEQYYYYNAGLAGGEISEFVVGATLLVKGTVGAITKVETVGEGVKVAKVVMDNGDEVVAVVGKESDNIAIVAASKLDDVADASEIVYRFKSEKELFEHFSKHADQLKEIFEHNSYSIEQYIDDANYVIKNGTYVKERNAFVKFIAGDKYAFVGLDAESNITTFHIKSVEWLKKFAPSLGIN